MTKVDIFLVSGPTGLKLSGLLGEALDSIRKNKLYIRDIQTHHSSAGWGIAIITEDYHDDDDIRETGSGEKTETG